MLSILGMSGILYITLVLFAIMFYQYKIKNYKSKNSEPGQKLFLGHGISSINYCVSTPISIVYFIFVDKITIFIYEMLLEIVNGSSIIPIVILILKVFLFLSAFLLLNITLYPISEIKHILEIDNKDVDKLKFKFFKTMFFYGILCFIWVIGILYLISVKYLLLNIIICPIIFYLGMGDALEHPKTNKKRNILIRICSLLKSHITNCFKFLLNQEFRHSVNIEAQNNIKLIFKAVSSLTKKPL